MLKNIRIMLFMFIAINLIIINLVSCAGGSNDSGVDTTPPIIEINGNKSLSILVGSSFTDKGATASDNVDGVVSVVTSSNLDTSRIGTYQITYSATDAAGNNAQTTREIEVEATQIDTSAFEGSWISNCITEPDNNFKVSMQIAEQANIGSMVINGYTDECITSDYQASLNISLSYPSTHTSSVCSNAVKVNGAVNYPINVLVEGQTDPLIIENEFSLNSLGFFEEDFLVAFDLMCTNNAGTILYSGLVTNENNGSTVSKRPQSIDTDGFWVKQ